MGRREQAWVVGCSPAASAPVRSWCNRTAARTGRCFGAAAELQIRIHGSGSSVQQDGSEAGEVLRGGGGAASPEKTDEVGARREADGEAPSSSARENPSREPVERSGRSTFFIFLGHVADMWALHVS